MAAETDDSGTIDAHVYFNADPPQSVTLPEEEDTLYLVYLLAVDVDDDAARQDFDDGESVNHTMLYYFSRVWSRRGAFSIFVS